MFIAIILHNYAVDLACMTCPRKKNHSRDGFFFRSRLSGSIMFQPEEFPPLAKI